MVRLRNCGPDIYTGGLDRSSDLDGEFALISCDAHSQIVFHTSTLMPLIPQASGQNAVCTMLHGCVQREKKKERQRSIERAREQEREKERQRGEGG
jgi:Rap/ran-GAP